MSRVRLASSDSFWAAASFWEASARSDSTWCNAARISSGGVEGGGRMPSAARSRMASIHRGGNGCEGSDFGGGWCLGASSAVLQGLGRAIEVGQQVAEAADPLEIAGHVHGPAHVLLVAHPHHAALVQSGVAQLAVELVAPLLDLGDQRLELFEHLPAAALDEVAIGLARHADVDVVDRAEDLDQVAVLVAGEIHVDHVGAIDRRDLQVVPQPTQGVALLSERGELGDVGHFHHRPQNAVAGYLPYSVLPDRLGGFARLPGVLRRRGRENLQLRNGQVPGRQEGPGNHHSHQPAERRHREGHIPGPGP